MPPRGNLLENISGKGGILYQRSIRNHNMFKPHLKDAAVDDGLLGVVPRLEECGEAQDDPEQHGGTNARFPPRSPPSPP